MSVLSAAVQKQVETAIVEQGIISPEEFREIREKADEKGTPLFTAIMDSGKLSNEQLTKTIAHVTKMPYVNLTNATIDTNILTMLTKEIAERYMAVPLGEMNSRLVVAMLDADNVQAVDFLSNKIGRPLKVYAASEEGIKNVLQSI